MRGKVHQTADDLHAGRITPAYAGKSQGLTQQECAELGSPPPMRGKAEPQGEMTAEAGITPAYAGKRVYQAIRKCQYQDHPRLCGEKTKKIPKQRYFFHQSASFSFSLQYT